MRIGGLKEKTMAALRHGVSTVLIPADNERDLQEIDQTVRKQLNFIVCQTMDSVLEAALNKTTSVPATILTPIPENIAGKARKTGIRQ